MGYYDQDYDNKPKRQKGNRLGWLIPAITGAILGALLVLMSLPSFLNRDVTQSPSTENSNGTAQQQPQPSEIMNVNVVSQITDAVEKTSDAVVGVINIQETGFWSEQGEAGTGSGVVYKKENGQAFIVTNNHVVEGASAVEVSLKGGERVPAEVLGTDLFTDLAVLKIDGKLVKKVAELGASENLKPGEPVIAIGNPLGLRFSGSVTQGIISGVNRTIEIDLNNDGRPDWQSEVLQTDAAINPGNSGGALININGQVIGINSMKIARQAVEGIGLAIPMDTVKPVITDLESYGEVRRPFMGIGLRSVSEIASYHWQETLKLPQNIQEGVFIVNVSPGSPAARAGLKELDVMTALDGKPIPDVIALRKHLYTTKKIGDTMEVTFYRGGKKQSTTMKLTGENAY